eukprot:748052-Hanusia_phi.AAC.3
MSCPLTVNFDVTTCPFIDMILPLSTLSSDVFPLPLAPMIATTSPGFALPDSSLRTRGSFPDVPMTLGERVKETLDQAKCARCPTRIELSLTVLLPKLMVVSPPASSALVACISTLLTLSTCSEDIWVEEEGQHMRERVEEGGSELGMEKLQSCRSTKMNRQEQGNGISASNIINIQARPHQQRRGVVRFGKLQHDIGVLHI